MELYNILHFNYDLCNIINKYLVIKEKPYSKELLYYTREINEELDMFYGISYTIHSWKNSQKRYEWFLLPLLVPPFA